MRAGRLEDILVPGASRAGQLQLNRDLGRGPGPGSSEVTTPPAAAKHQRRKSPAQESEPPAQRDTARLPRSSAAAQETFGPGQRALSGTLRWERELERLPGRAVQQRPGDRKTPCSKSAPGTDPGKPARLSPALSVKLR